MKPICNFLLTVSSTCQQTYIDAGLKAATTPPPQKKKSTLNFSTGIKLLFYLLEIRSSALANNSLHSRLCCAALGKFDSGKKTTTTNFWCCVVNQSEKNVSVLATFYTEKSRQ